MKWIITGWFKGKEFTDQPGWFNWSVDGNRIDRLLSLFTIEKQCKRLAGQDKSIARDFYSFERRRNRVWKRKIDDACLRPRLSYNAKVQRCWFYTRNAGIRSTLENRLEIYAPVFQRAFRNFRQRWTDSLSTRYQSCRTGIILGNWIRIFST